MVFLSAGEEPQTVPQGAEQFYSPQLYSQVGQGRTTCPQLKPRMDE